MRRSWALVQYTITALALVAGFALSIRFSDRGYVLDAEAGSPLATATVTEGDYDLTSLRLLSRVALQITNSYVEPERIDGKKMLVRAIDRVQKTVPELVAIFSSDMDKNPASVEIRIGTQKKVFDISKVQSPWEVPLHLRQIFSFIGPHIDTEETKLQEVEYAAVNGMLDTLDPHTTLLTPDVYDDMKNSNRGNFGGLGIVISIRGGELTVISPMPDTPAGRAGIKSGDKILKINEDSTINMPLDEAVGRLRGPPGTTVTVEFMRHGWSEAHKYTFEREEIEVQSVTSKALANNIGYVQVRGFQGNTAREVGDAVNALSKEMGGMKGLVLDLRNNPGGLLREAISISDLFLESGTIVTTVGEADKLRDEVRANRAGTQPNYPLVLLMNPGSASASEVVAGALKNNDRAIVVGERSFGKGSVQNVLEMDDGSALKLTIAQYLTPGRNGSPNGVSIQGVGIVPDVQLVPVSITDKAVDLYPSTEVLREGDLETHLASSHTATEQELPSSVIKYYHEPEEADPEAINDPNEFKLDMEITIAHDMLVAAGPVWERSAVLAKAQPAIDKLAQQQAEEIRLKLVKQKIDWSRADNVIQPIKLQITSDHPNNQVTVGEKIKLTVSATNLGNRPLSQVRAVSESSYEAFTDQEWIFGRVEPGATATWTVEVTVPQEDTTRVDEIRFKAFADEIDLGSSASAFIRVEGKPRPQFGFSYWIDDSESGNSDGLLQVGESVKFHMLVRNTGGGEAGKVNFNIRNKSESAVFITNGRGNAPKLGVGEEHTSIFDFSVRSRPADGSIKLDAEVFDTDYIELLRETLSIPVDEAGAATPTATANASAEVASRRAPIYAGAMIGTPMLTEVEAGAILRVVGQRTDWFRVELEKARFGWVPAAAVKLRAKPAPTSVHPPMLLQFQAPFIDLKAGPSITDQASITISGVVSDDHLVKDLYIFVENESSPFNPQSVKRAYESIDLMSSPFSAEIPLRPGYNRILLIARDNDKATTSEVSHIYRSKSANAP